MQISSGQLGAARPWQRGSEMTAECSISLFHFLFFQIWKHLLSQEEKKKPRQQQARSCCVCVEEMSQCTAVIETRSSAMLQQPPNTQTNSPQQSPVEQTNPQGIALRGRSKPVRCAQLCPCHVPLDGIAAWFQSFVPPSNGEAPGESALPTVSMLPFSVLLQTLRREDE